MSIGHRLADLSHCGSDIQLAYVDYPAATKVAKKGIILLIHGFPQTSFQFRHVLPLLSEAGFRCIVPDYRGAGQSAKPEDGFQKASMARDLIALLNHLDITNKVNVVGHDIGGMIAFAMASRHPDRVRSLCWGECPLPGTTLYNRDRTDNAVQQFHFIFHSVPDLPEALVAGKERIYVTHFLNKICYNLDAFPEDAIDHYVAAYAQPGAMRCAFGVYRAFEDDAQKNTAWIAEHGKCVVPSLVLSGEHSRYKNEARIMAAEVSEFGLFEVDVVPGADHYLAEENPQGFAEIVLAFIERVVQL